MKLFIFTALDLRKNWMLLKFDFFMTQTSLDTLMSNEM